MRRLLLLSLLALTVQAYPAYRVALGTSASAGVWQADSSFCSGGSAFALTLTSKGPLPPYSSLRYGASFSCIFRVDPGVYSVGFSFIEPNAIRAGQRVFSATVNGAPAISNLDLFAVAGTSVPYDVGYPNVSVTDGTIKVQFTGVTGNAVASGITITPQVAIPPPNATGDTLVAGPGIQFNGDGQGHTIIRLDPGYQGVGFRPWISPVFPGPDSSVVIPAKDHGIHYLPDCAIVVEVWDASDPATIRRITADVIAEDTIAIDRKTCDVTITFKAPRSQYLVVVR